MPPTVDVATTVGNEGFEMSTMETLLARKFGTMISRPFGVNVPGQASAEPIQTYRRSVATGLDYGLNRFYDPAQNGGLWLGKAYGGPNDYWKRDPLHNLSHGATTMAVARFFLLLQQGRLVSPEYSAEMKEILSKPDIVKSDPALHPEQFDIH